MPYPSRFSLWTRYLYSFRRIPAISEFDWHFTPMHKSSQILATITSSFLLHLLRVLSNCSCIDHSVSGPISSDFLVLTSLSLARPYHLQIHYTKGTPFFSMTALVSLISGSLSLQPCLSFHLSLTLLVLYRCSFVFSLRGLVPLSSNFVLMFYSSLPSAPFYGALLPSLSSLFAGGFRLFEPRSPLLHVSLLISFPPVT